MTKSTRKQLVLAVAKDMCKVSNKLSTKELKIELRNRFPEELWNKYDNGEGVSDLFHQLVNDGHFVSVADNGTYQTYASVSFPIANRKGAPYIPDIEDELPSAPQKAHSTTAVANLGIALSKASATKRPVGRPRKNPVIQAPLASTKTIKVAKTTTPAITRSKALELMQNNKGRFFTAVFVKQDGTERTMNCRYLKDQTLSQLGYVKVTDEALRKTNPTNCTRNINLQTLSKLSIGGVQYKIK